MWLKNYTDFQVYGAVGQFNLPSVSKYPKERDHLGQSSKAVVQEA